MNVKKFSGINLSLFALSLSYSLYQEEQKKQQDTTLEQTCNGVADAPKVKLSTKKLLKGHINKVNSVHYSGDNRLVLVNC